MKQQEHTDDQHPVRKALQSLPAVKASPDFESRLQRRLNEPVKGGVWFGNLGIPAFAFSVLTLVVVSTVSYLLVNRTQDERDVHGGRSPSTTILRDQDSSLSLQKPSEELKSTPQVSGESNVTVEQNSSPAASDRAGQKTVVSSPPKFKQEKRLRNEAVPSEVESSAPVPSRTHQRQVTIPDNNLEVQSSIDEASIDSQVKENNDAIPQTVEPSPAAKSLMKFRNSETPATILDSAALRDSLRADSLKKLLNKIPRKIRRPD